MRWWRMACVALVIVLGAGLLPGGTPRAAAIGTWTVAAAPPNIPGNAPPALVTLPDGRALLTRFGDPTTPSPRQFLGALYDPDANSWKLTATPDPANGVAAPVLLRDGTVLVSGGGDSYLVYDGNLFGTAGAQRYDPVADRWVPTGALARPRARHTATLLPDGSVLVAGGRLAGSAAVDQEFAEAERYDPQTGTWAVTGALSEARNDHGAVALRDGRVLVVGGVVDVSRNTPPRNVLSAELYDPATGRWATAAAPLRTHGGRPSVTLLADGRVLVAGGIATRGDTAGVIDQAEIYDPATDSWSLTAPLRLARSGHGAALLPDGRVLVAGEGPFSELYDPASGTWVSEEGAPAGSLALAALRDGRALAVGYGAAIYSALPTRAGRCFAETGHCIAGKFLAYWEANGGLARNGYPIGGEVRETLEDGKTYTVQYFERVRMEYHPEIGDPRYQVLLGQFGRRVLSAAYGESALYDGYQRATAPVAPLPGARFFAETGHNISPLFLAYWEANGGLAQFGYPITEERYDSLGTGAGACCKTQYFERARFEYHPENAGTPYEVLLGQFGRQLQADNAQLGPTFGALYLANTEVRERLGAPRIPELRLPGAVQPFERGLMIWRGDQRRIFVLAGTQVAGRLVTGRQEYSTIIAWEDTWAEGQDPGGGAGPSAGLYLPQRGFGKLWREQEFRNDLGYATTPNEAGYAMILQEFAAGYLLTVDSPNGRAIYAIYLQAAGSHNVLRIGTYARVAER